MAVMLPPDLETAFGVLGVPWPTEDEDRLGDCATAYRVCAATLAGEVVQIAHGAIQHAAASNHGLGMDAATAFWADYYQDDDGDSHLPSLATVLNALADAHDMAAALVTALKGLLIALAFYVVAVLVRAVAEAVVTGGKAAIQARLALTGLRAAARRAVAAFRLELERFSGGTLVRGVETRLRRILSAAEPLTRWFKEPPIRDMSGYRITARERAFAGVSRRQLWNMHLHRTPLGMKPKEWRTAVAELDEALMREGIPNADVRLNGTSVFLYSGDRKKVFPQTEHELRERVRQALSDVDPAVRERRVEEAVETYRRAGYGGDDPQPAVLYFDIGEKLGLSRWRSDFDFQLGSADLVERFERFGEANPGINLHTKGDWYNPYLLDRVAPELDKWVKRWEEKTGRWVSIAVYPPEYVEANRGPRDWVVLPRDH